MVITKEIPKFTPAEREVIRFLLKTGNNFAYPALIEKGENIKVTKAWAGKICKELKMKGILSSKKLKPPRRGQKTDWYRLEPSVPAFLQVAYNFLRTPEEYELINSIYAQEMIGKDLLSHILNRIGCAKRYYVYTELIDQKDLDKLTLAPDQYTFSVYYPFTRGDLSPSEFHNKLKEYNPLIPESVLDNMGRYISKMASLTPEQEEEIIRTNEFNRLMKLNPDSSPEEIRRIAANFIGRGMPREDTEENTQQLLNILRISPTALYDSLFLEDFTGKSPFDTLGIPFNDPEMLFTKYVVTIQLDLISDISKFRNLPTTTNIEGVKLTIEFTAELQDKKKQQFNLGFEIWKKGSGTMQLTDFPLDVSL